MTMERKSQDSTAAVPWVYFSLVALQTAGAALLYWKTLPLFRQVVANPGAFVPREKTPTWAIVGVLLIQGAFWTRHHLRPLLPRFANAPLGHLVQFSARLVFTLATTVWSFAFFTQNMAPQMSVGRLLLTLIGMFSLFCYMQELYSLGTALNGPDKTAPQQIVSK
jgi:hypothetical protein